MPVSSCCLGELQELIQQVGRTNLMLWLSLMCLMILEEDGILLPKVNSELPTS